MNEASVVRDALLQLGQGQRRGAAQVLAELFALDPALLREALELACDGPHRERVLAGTRLASAWVEGLQRQTWIRWDRLRALQPVGRVSRAGLVGAGEVYEAMVGPIRTVGLYDSLLEAQMAVDDHLRIGEERWFLREVDPRARGP